jgi:hypothetical protein
MVGTASAVPFTTEQGMLRGTRPVPDVSDLAC